MADDAWEVVPLTSATWPFYVELFGGPEGGCGGCWCTWWRMSRGSWYAAGKHGRLTAMKEIVESGAPTGILLLTDDGAIGWCAVAPHHDYPTLLRSPVAYPIDQTASWCISCLFVKAGHRRKGLMSSLITAAADWAFAQGAEVVDGFPQTSGRSSSTVDRFVGTEASFRKAGFDVIEPRGKRRLAVRKNAT